VQPNASAEGRPATLAAASRPVIVSGTLPSVLSSWSRTIVDALEAVGVDADAALASAGLSRDALSDPNARLPATVAARLWAAAADLAGDPAFGLRASQFVRPTTFHALGYAVFASATLRDALDRLVRYSHVVTSSRELSLTIAGGVARLSIEGRPSGDRPSYEAVDAVMSLIVRTCRSLTDRSFSLSLVEQRRATPADAAPYERFFRCPVRFGARVDALTCGVDALDRPLPTANPELAVHNDELVRRYLAEMQQGSVVDRVRAVLAEAPGASATPARVATALGMSVRSLQRRLGEHGVSYLSLVQRVRTELGQAYLIEDRYSVTEIAFRLGFDDASAFSRAFRRWTGLSPTEYRERAAGAAR
jgi:AraC-like DNA-binding protein